MYHIDVVNTTGELSAVVYRTIPLLLASSLHAPPTHVYAHKAHTQAEHKAREPLQLPAITDYNGDDSPPYFEECSQ